MAEDAGPGLAELLADVRRIEVQSRRLATDVMSGGYLSVFRGAGLAFESVREYAEGDDPRRVDWNVTARLGRPYVKTFVEERELTLLFLFDLSASMTGGFGPESPRHTAARVVACLALSAVRNGDQAGLVAFGSDVVSNVPAGKGAGHALRIVRDCLALGTSPGRTDPAAALDLVARTVRRRAVVFLVSDFLSDLPTRSLSLCARRHDLIAVRLLSPELDPPRGAGLLRLRDPETGHASVVDFEDARVRAAYLANAAAWRARTEETLARARVDLLDVAVPRVSGRDVVATAILRFFRMRELRGMKR